jgi:hypothetical protein
MIRPHINIGLIGYWTRELIRIRVPLTRRIGKEWTSLDGLLGPDAEVLRIIRRRKNPVRGFLENIPVPNIFLWRGDSIDPCVRPTPPLVGTRLSTRCLTQCA